MNAHAIGSIYGCRRLVATLIVSVTADAAAPVKPKKASPQLELPLDLPERVGEDEYDLYEFAQDVPAIVGFWGLEVDGNRIRRGLIQHIDGERRIRPEMLKLDQRDSDAVMRRNGRAVPPTTIRRRHVGGSQRRSTRSLAASSSGAIGLTM
jgi:hypothetical protein